MEYFVISRLRGFDKYALLYPKENLYRTRATCGTIDWQYLFGILMGHKQAMPYVLKSSKYMEPIGGPTSK